MVDLIKVLNLASVLPNRCSYETHILFTLNSLHLQLRHDSAFAKIPSLVRGSLIVLVQIPFYRCLGLLIVYLSVDIIWKFIQSSDVLLKGLRDLVSSIGLELGSWHQLIPKLLWYINSTRICADLHASWNGRLDFGAVFLRINRLIIGENLLRSLFCQLKTKTILL